MHGPPNIPPLRPHRFANLAPVKAMPPPGSYEAVSAELSEMRNMSEMVYAAKTTLENVTVKHKMCGPCLTALRRVEGEVLVCSCCGKTNPLKLVDVSTRVVPESTQIQVMPALGINKPAASAVVSPSFSPMTALGTQAHASIVPYTHYGTPVHILRHPHAHSGAFKVSDTIYLEFVHHQAAAAYASILNGQTIMGNEVRVSVRSQVELMHAVFPQWDGTFGEGGHLYLPPQMPVERISGEMDTEGGGLQRKLITREELHSILVACRAKKDWQRPGPYRLNRPYDHLISVITKFSWHAGLHYSTKLLRAGLLVPCFTDKQKMQLQATSHLAYPEDLLPSVRVQPCFGYACSTVASPAFISLVQRIEHHLIHTPIEDSQIVPTSVTSTPPAILEARMAAAAVQLAAYSVEPASRGSEKYETLMSMVSGEPGETSVLGLTGSVYGSTTRGPKSMSMIAAAHLEIETIECSIAALVAMHNKA
ncbi:hypothetical protein YB2330_005297 [Saitoella coloradoensis]